MAIPTYEDEYQQLKKLDEKFIELLVVSDSIEEGFKCAPHEKLLEKLGRWESDIDCVLKEHADSDLKYKFHMVYEGKPDIADEWALNRMVFWALLRTIEDSRKAIQQRMDEIKRQASIKPEEIKYGKFIVKPSDGSILFDGLPITVSGQPKQLLLGFFGKKDHVLSIPEIMNLLWGDGIEKLEFKTNKNVYSVVNKLNDALRVSSDRSKKVVKGVYDSDTYTLQVWGSKENP